MDQSAAGAALALIVVALGLGACAPAQVSRGPAPLPLDAEYAVYDAAAERLVTLEEAADRLADADVVFFGEVHDDPETHEVELALLEEIAERRQNVVLSLEMFERDVQPVLDQYVRGTIEEEVLLASARPWTNYGTDYRPLVMLAREKEWPVLAANLPQSLATAVARGGIEALDELSPHQRGFAAVEHDCSADAYWTRFVDAITESADSSGHAAISPDDPMFRSMFEAQCARDEAMAESIASVASTGTLLYHVTGAFHSDYRQGTVSRLLRRNPDLDVRVISAIPIADMGALDVAEHIGRADYLLFTRAPS